MLFKLALLLGLVALVAAQCDPYCCTQGGGGSCSTKFPDTCNGVCTGVCDPLSAGGGVPSQCECLPDCVSTSCTTATCQADGSCLRVHKSAGTNCGAPTDFCDGFRCDGAGTCLSGQEPCPSEFACEIRSCFDTTQSCGNVNTASSRQFCTEKYADSTCISEADCKPEQNSDEDGCIVAFLDAGTPCGEPSTDLCNTNACAANGECVASPVVDCSQPYSCATSVCNPTTGQCEETYDDSVCDYLDGQCSSGVCLTAGVVDNDENGCQLVPENENGGCTGCAIPAGGNPECYACTCFDGQCIASSNPGTCTVDPNGCFQEGVCVQQGTVFVCVGNTNAQKPAGSACDDGVACTNDACNANGVCVGSPSNQFCENLLSGECTESVVCDPTGNGDENGCLVTFKSSGVLCGPSNGCDTDEFCTGSSPNCPPQVPLPAGTVCEEGFGCRADKVCDGSTDACPFESVPLPAGTLCLGSRGPCQEDSFCDGSSFECLSVYLTGECRAASGLCDEPEFCTGTSPQCPEEDEVKEAGVVCGPGSGDVCDPDETCDGINKACPFNVVKPADFVCREGSGDGCDPDEFCTGVAGQPCPDQECNFLHVCRQAAGECDLAERCPLNEIACQNDELVCPPDAFVAAGTPCGVDDGNSCTVQACSGNSSDCITTVLPDDTECTNECGTGSCQSGICLCPCELECVLTRGAVARNSPSAKGKARNDPVWQTDFFQDTVVCESTPDEFFNSKKNQVILPAGCENDLLAQYYTIVYNTERYKLSTGVACDGLFGEDEVQDVMDEVENWIPTLNAFTCETTSVPQCATKVAILSNFSEGLNSVEHCSSSLPIEIAAIADSSAQAAHNHTHSSGGSDDDSDLGAGGIVAIVFASIVGLILLALAALLCLGVWGNAFAKDSSSKKSRRYSLAADEDDNDY